MPIFIGVALCSIWVSQFSLECLVEDRGQQCIEFGLVTGLSLADISYLSLQAIKPELFLIIRYWNFNFFQFF